LYGKTDNNQNKITVTLGLGGYGSTNTGKVWFDDVSIEKVDNPPENILIEDLFIKEAPQDLSDNVVAQQDSSISYSAYYTLIYLLILIILIFIIKNNRFTLNKLSDSIHVYIILCAGFLIRVILAQSVEGFSTDISCFKAWSSAAANDLAGFYRTGMFADYPPVYIYVLFIIGKLVNLFNIAQNASAYITIIKLPAIISDLLLAYIIFRLSCKHLSKGASTIILSIITFNPALFLNSSLWGQVDSVFTLLVAVSIILAYYEKLPLACAFASMSVLMKPQGIIFLPVIFFELIKRKNIKEIVLSVIYSTVTAVIIILPFTQSGNIFWIIDLYKNTASGYTHASLNAFNLFSLLGANLKDDSSILFLFSYNMWGYIFIGLMSLFTGFLYLKAGSKRIVALAALVQIFGVFVLTTRMHERYGFPAVSICLMCFVIYKDNRFFHQFILLTTTIFINMYMVLEKMLLTGNPHISPHDFVLKIISLLNVLILGYLIKTSIDIIYRKKVTTDKFIRKLSE
jgi:Gpi18-like mannosyltransferase